MSKRVLSITLLLWLGLAPALVRAESQNNDYKGITDPFGDPANYEFAEDEKEDKEFFHLGRYLMIGFDVGAGIFTGALGNSTAPGLNVGTHLIYFFDRSIAFEAAAHFSKHLDSVRPSTGGFADIDTKVYPLTLGFRFYFDTRDAPKAIAISNPYLAFGGGAYIREQVVIDSSPELSSLGLPVGSENLQSAFGVYGGGGIEFPIYRRHIYLGLDMRYHLVFFSDEGESYGDPDDRAGDLMSAHVSITYNF